MENNEDRKSLSFIGFMGFQDEVFFVLLQTAKTM
jgi:hypothetical protein